MTEGVVDIFTRTACSDVGGDSVLNINVNYPFTGAEQRQLCKKIGTSDEGVIDVILTNTGKCPNSDWEKTPSLHTFNYGAKSGGDLAALMAGSKDSFHQASICYLKGSNKPKLKDFIYLSKTETPPPGAEKLPWGLGTSFGDFYKVKIKYEDLLLEKPEEIQKSQAQQWCSLNPEKCNPIIPLISDKLVAKNIFPKYLADWSMKNMGKNDNFMKAYCEKNKDAPECACINSDVTKYKFNPLCQDKKCIEGGYSTNSMITALGDGCQIVDCSTYFDIKAKGKVTFEDVEIQQRCGEKESNTTKNTTNKNENKDLDEVKEDVVNKVKTFWDKIEPYKWWILAVVVVIVLMMLGFGGLILIKLLKK